MTRWVNNFPQKCQFKSFDQWKLALIFSPYKPELSMIRSCPNRLEFKNECYSTVNSQSAKNIDICINFFMGRTKTKPFLKRKKVPKLYFHFWPPKKCPPFFFLIHIVTVCVFVCHVFSYHPFYFDFHSARIIFDVSSGFYLWNINRTTTWHL